MRSPGTVLDLHRVQGLVRGQRRAPAGASVQSTAWTVPQAAGPRPPAFATHSL